MGCLPQPWSPVVDTKIPRPCVAGHKVTWKEQSPCEIDSCVHDCLMKSKRCTDVFEDDSKDCRDCKFSCSDWFSKSGLKELHFQPWSRKPWTADKADLSKEERW